MTETLQTLDSQLIRMAAAGDSSAFDRLMGQHRNVLRSLALRKLRNLEDTNDVLQETFIKAFKAIQDFDSSRPIRPWLCRICSNCCIDAVRLRKREGEPLDLHENLLIADEPEPCDNGSGMEYDTVEIMRAINRLPSHYRSIITMRHFEHLDVIEIAEAMGKPEGTIKSWLFRARLLLRKELERVSYGYAA